jgi:hypothetical protein
VAQRTRGAQPRRPLDRAGSGARRSTSWRKRWSEIAFLSFIAGSTSQQDLPTWTHFEQATQIVTEDDATEHVPCGPDIAGEVVKSAQEYLEAGYDHLYFHQIGPAQSEFFRFWEAELRGALDDLG